MTGELFAALMKLELRIMEAIHSLDSRLSSVETKITSLENSVEGFREETLSHLDGVYTRFDRLESEYYSLNSAVTRLESGHQSLSAAVTRIEARLEN
jgi:uncharacterized protein YdcH (DUF465 family)